MKEDFTTMMENSKKMIVRRSLYALMVAAFVMGSSTSVFAETYYQDEDVGTADIRDDRIDAEIDDDTDVGFDSDVDPYADTSGDVEVDDDINIDRDTGRGDDADSMQDASEGADAVTDESDVDGTDLLYVDVGVEVEFDGDAPDVVTLGLTGLLGEVAPVDVSVSTQGVAVWEATEIRGGKWTLSATAKGYEPVNYRFVAGDSSQKLIRVSMNKVGSFGDTNIESGWSCSSVGSAGGAPLFILVAAFSCSVWIQRRRKR